MKLHVLYFAGLREALGLESEQVEVPQEVADVAALKAWLADRGEPWGEALAGPRPVLSAVNEEMAGESTTLGEGDTVAFFPPVTGG